MKPKILLIRPANIFDYNNYPSLGLISVASAVRMKGYEVMILNSFLEKDILGAIEKEIEGALLVGITLLTSEVPDARRIIRFIREHSKVPIVVGGWHTTLFPEQMAAPGEIDCAVAGEGETHIVRIAEMIARGDSPDRKIFAPEILDMDALPVPDYNTDPNIEHFIGNYLTDKLSEVVPQPMRWLPYQSSRGCPSQCTFCINVVTGNTRYRKKNAEKVISEIEEIVRKHRLTHVKIIDDNFFVDIHRARRIAEGLIERGVRITWDAECRCDYFNDRMLNDETLSLMKHSGLVQLTLGIESGSMHTLELMKKGITPEQAEFAVSQCDRHGIIARSSFIIEVPGETMSDIRKTIAFVNRLRKYRNFTCGVQTFRPYPRCELTQGLIEKGLLREPKSFEEWTDPEVIKLYVAARYIAPWQVSGKFSATAAEYLTAESGTSLGAHQMKRAWDRFWYSSFVALARLRNRTGFYRWPLDQGMYKRFFEGYYRRTGRK